MNKKGIPQFMKEFTGREIGDYTILYEVGGKLTLHSWIDKSPKGIVLYLRRSCSVCAGCCCNQCWGFQCGSGSREPNQADPDPGLTFD
jgi:hypothetical protein